MACAAPCRERRTEPADAAPSTAGREAVPLPPVAAGVPIFLRATISRPGDPEEQEAEHRSAEFVRRSQTTGGCNCGSGKDGETACTCGSVSDERAIFEASSVAVPADHPSTRTTAAAPRHGLTLTREIRRPYEDFFGVDLSQVRVHDGREADLSAKALHARAYTYGQDIVFAAGEFAPRSAQGQSLLAHELTHVVQHSRGGAGIARQPRRTGK